MNHDWYDVSIFLQEVGVVKVKGTSQRDAEEKIRRFCEVYNNSSSEDQLYMPTLPFKLKELEFREVEVIDSESIPSISKKENDNYIYNKVINSESYESLNNTSISKEEYEQIKNLKDKDVSDIKDWVELK